MPRPGDRLVDDYLTRLDEELRDLPRARRRELVEDIAEHTDEKRSRDKLIGTLVVPGGLGLAFYLVVIASGPSTVCSTETDAADHVLSSTCGGGGVSAGDILLYILLGALVVGPIFTTVYLARRMWRAQAPDLALDLG
jgi:HAAS domain-containing protein